MCVLSCWFVSFRCGVVCGLVFLIGFSGLLIWLMCCCIWIGLFMLSCLVFWFLPVVVLFSGCLVLILVGCFVDDLFGVV